MSLAERTSAVSLGGLDGANVTDVTLRFRSDLTEERAAQIVHLLGRIDRSAKWWLAAWISEYTERFGQDDGTRALAVASEATGYSEATLANMRDVDRMLPERVRDGRLDFSSHSELSRLVRAGLGVEVVEEVRDRLLEMRDEWTRTSGLPFPNHKVARKVVSEVIRERGVADRMFHFPTSEEQIADLSAERDRLEAELSEARLRTGEYVKCPACGKVQPVETARIVA